MPKPSAYEGWYLALSGLATLRQAFSYLARGAGRMRTHLLVRKSDGTWTAARLDQLLSAASEDSGRLDRPLDALDLFTPVHGVERNEMGSGAARRLARVSPGGLLVITDQGEFAGILCAAELRGALATRRDLESLIAGTVDLPESRNVLHGKTGRDLRSGQGTQEERHTDISCPRQVWKGTPRFNLVVRLTRGPALQSVAPGVLEVETGQVMRVDLQAPAFEILNAPGQEIALPPNQDSAPVVFDLRPREVGSHQLILDFFQAGNPLGAATVAVEVTEQPAPESQARVPSCTLSPLSGKVEIAPPDRVLRIGWYRETRSLSVSLLEAGGSSWRELSSRRMEHDPEAWATLLFQSLSTLSRGSDPAAEAVLSERLTLSRQGIDRRLKLLGHRLWQVLPEELRSLYAQERQAWRDSSLLIYSDEPHLPWELVWPYGEGWEDPEPWCLTLRLSRWLRRDERGEGNRGAPGRLPLTALACLAPGGARLPAARGEQACLRNLLQPLGVRDVSPPEPTWEAAMDLLESGRYDWLHVAAHGSFYAAAPDQHSALWLERREALTPQHIAGPDVESHLREARPAFLFNACHAGRSGLRFTGIGGWADRLLACGAGMFLGPFWTVADSTALLMAQTLYDQLLKGESVAEATRQARRAARRPGDPSWLAYSVYAHPNARVVLPDYSHSNTRPSLTQV